MEEEKGAIGDGKICPRCGRRYTYIEKRRIGGNVYLYCVHESRKGGKRTVIKHYIGPEEGYIYGNIPNRIGRAILVKTEERENHMRNNPA